MATGALETEGKLHALLQRASEVASSLERRAHEDRVFRTVTEKINAGVYLDDIANHVYDSFREFIPFDRIGLALLDPGDQVLRARWARAEYDATAIARGFSAPVRGSSLERILETGEPRIINDLVAYAASHPESESTARILSEGIRSSLTCPLIAAGRPVGFLFFSSLTPGVYASEHARVYQEIANTLAVVVERASMLERLAYLNEELVARNRALRVANARVRRLTVTDSLTRVANRRGLMAALKAAASLADRRHLPLSVVALDLDHFKRVNDEHGHDAGDRALRHVGKLARTCRKEDLVGRMGGEEFCILLPATDETQAAVVAERLRSTLEATPVPALGLRLTASFGVAQRQAGEPLPALLARADRALYQAKAAGRNRVVCCSAPSHDQRDLAALVPDRVSLFSGA